MAEGRLEPLNLDWAESLNLAQDRLEPLNLAQHRLESLNFHM